MSETSAGGRFSCLLSEMRRGACIVGRCESSSVLSEVGWMYLISALHSDWAVGIIRCSGDHIFGCDSSRSGFSCAIALLFLNAVFPNLGRHTVLAHVGWLVNN